MQFWNNPQVVGKSPVISALAFEYANVGQIYRIWTEHTAAGHNLWSWMAVNLGLLLFVNFYRVCCPQEKFAFWATMTSVGINFLLIASIVYWRYLV